MSFMTVWEIGESEATADSLVKRRRAIPEIGAHEVLVRMHAASLNYRDLRILDGQYRFSRKPGMVPLSDGAGEVVEIGEGVESVRPGQRVMGTFFPRWRSGPVNEDLVKDQPGSLRDGMLAQYVSFHQDALVTVPDHLSYIEAATLPCAASTAWVSLAAGARPLLPGETVLTLGTGGVALFAVQIAKLFGARVIATTSDDRKADRLVSLGADEVINYRSMPQWDECVKQRTGGTGVDHVIEVGGAGTLERSLRATAVGGVVNMIGFLEQGGNAGGANIMAGGATIRRIHVGSRADLQALCRAFAQHRVKPVVDRVFSFEEVTAAYRHFESRKFMGKVAIAIV